MFCVGVGVCFLSFLLLPARLTHICQGDTGQAIKAGVSTLQFTSMTVKTIYGVKALEEFNKKVLCVFFNPITRM